MWRWLCVLCLLLAGCVDPNLQPVTPTRGQQFTGKVVGVPDGDTVTVLDASRAEHRVRLAFVDAPEKAQAWGNTAKWQLSARIYGQQVRAEVFDVDRYGRAVARIWLDNEDINLALVRAGLAWHYTQYARRMQAPAEFERYAAAERQARERRLGLWQNARPQAPWQYRQRQRRQ